MNFICKLCGHETTSQYKLIKHLSQGKIHKFDKIQLRNYYDLYIKKEDENKCKICNNSTEYLNGVKGYLLYCDYCNKRKHFPNCKEYWIIKGYSTEEAKLKANDIQLQRGLKAQKSIFNNILEHKKKSKFCKEYWIAKGYTEKESIDILTKRSKKAINICSKDRKNNPKKYLSPTTKEYWIGRGVSETIAENNARYNIQKQKGKCTLKFYIDRYGTQEGTKKYRIYCESRRNSLNRFTNAYGKIKGIEKYKEWKLNTRKAMIKLKNHGWSKISQLLFWEIYDKIKDDYKEIYFATNNNGIQNNHINNEYIVKYGKKEKYHRLDFYIKDINKCIEYDEAYWHKNEKSDEQREIHIKKELKGIKIMRISSIDFKDNRDSIITRCLEFIHEI